MLSRWVSMNVLRAIGGHGEARLSRAQIERACDAGGKSLESSLLKLRQRGLVCLDKDTRLYSITQEGRGLLDSNRRFTSGPRGPQPGKRLFRGTLRERAWRAMRILKKFTLGDVLDRLELAQARDAESNVGKYLRALAKSGFVAELRARERGAAPTSNGAKRYLLVRDAGPQAPRWLPRRGIVYDPNEEREHPL